MSNAQLTYKYRLKNRDHSAVLRQHAWACNQVWNWCVAQHKDMEERYRAGAKPRRRVTAFDLNRLCKGVGRELGLNQQTVQCVCEQFTRSRDLRRQCPRFRASDGPRRALGWVPFQEQSRQIDGNSVIYRGRHHRWFANNRRPLPERAKGGAFVEDARGRWYVCFQVEVSDLPTGNAMVGIDLGLKAIATCSDGAKIENLRHVATWSARLAKARRARDKRRARAVHAKIKNCRRDYLHKVSCRLARESALIAVGNVSSSQLVKTRMAKSVLDAGWASFKNMLRYKASRHGATFVEVDEAFTTQTCSSCGSMSSETRPRGIAGLGIREWVCSDCGTRHDRDVNAARNILALALSAQRRDDESRTDDRRISTRGLSDDPVAQETAA